MSMECQECDGIMECIFQFVAMGSVHWCPRCGTLAAGSHPTDWKVPFVHKVGAENQLRTKQLKIPGDRCARVTDLNTGLMIIFEGPALIPADRYKILSFFSKDKLPAIPPHPTNVCEYDRRSLEEVPRPPSECNHPSLPPGNPTTFPCHQQNCPWPERQKDEEWWNNHPGKHVRDKYENRPPYEAARWDPNVDPTY